VESTHFRVFAADVYLTVTIEGDGFDGTSGLHLHAGGQGVWIARMVRSLGEEIQLHAALGGETGLVVEQLIRSAGIAVHPIARSTPTQGYVHDRRSGARVEIASMLPAPLDRHERDDLYEDLLAAATDCALLFVTGRAGHDSLPEQFYERLGADLVALDSHVVGDLHGAELDAMLSAGRLDVLKVSDEDLARDGIACCDGGLLEWGEGLYERGAERIVISRCSAPTLALWEGRWLQAIAPQMAEADHRGAGDSMTAALGVALSRQLSGEEALALACGAGAASVTRHGLATVDARLISELASRVEVEPLPNGVRPTSRR
jgi:1-phosphofructokinase